MGESVAERPSGRPGLEGRPAGRVVRFLVEYGLPFAVAVILVPFIISGGRPWPWAPAMIDLDVYRFGVQSLLSGQGIYDVLSPGWNLAYIYPPFAAIIMLPLAVGPVWLWRLLWIALLVWAQQSVLRRCGVPRGGVLGLVGATALVAVEPLRTTLGYGQVNTLLMALVVLDLLPDRRRRWPRGVGIGVAAAIKLTPALFGVFALFARRARIAWTSAAAFAVATLLGVLVLPRESLRFWTGDIPAGTSGPQYVGNQSMSGLATRFFGLDLPGRAAGVLLGVLVALLAIVVARYWWLTGHRVFALALVGLATNLASPLAWTHHFVWVLPLLVAVITDTGLPTWVRRIGLAWGVWISIQLPLTVLPYTFDAAAHYTFGQDLLANVTPLVGLVLYVGLFVALLRRPRGEAAAYARAVEEADRSETVAPVG
ncbi:glycosyltransferase 87 family protein [Raineyella sp. LH-20]|uniref:glycosyltransferase 87 family protein n=1 Tax=Raineyella sp. LH-20 TaxID=3081204 RepID=UPI002952F213|nr:glycosyltransferase 87 family protein [Raineyella sp. LH-20]WOP18339.1 glycosyltransferase 87 family protein [Raineyella sp. LH-20]